ncbi:hypothetical protein EPN44_10565 [bacterium]|nr:MAG: hypothetical protein EPN44_10565 [bacterium]
MRRGFSVLPLLLFAVVAGCNGGVGSGTPPAPGTVNGQSQVNSASNVSDEQAAGDVVDYYLQRMTYAAPSRQMESRIVALHAFAARAAGATPSPVPSNADAALPAADVPLPSAPPSFVPQRLEPPSFPSDDGPAKRLAEQGAATLAHRVADAKSPTQAPVDRIDVTRGAVQWHIELLTGRISYAREHTAGVIESGAERAHEIAEAFVTRHGGLPDDAMEVGPVYTMTQGDNSSAPKPTSITFVWRHGDPSIIGADAITATVTPTATSLSASPSPSSGLEVTAYTRLWRKAGKTLDAGGIPPMPAARALAALAHSVALPANEKVKAVVFGGLRGPASAAPPSTVPAWAFEVGDSWYAVNALDGVVSGSTVLGVPSDAIAMVAAPKPKTATAAPTR